MVSTSTWERSRVVPVSTEASITLDGALAYVLDGVVPLRRVDAVDRATQRAVVLGQLVADQHLVEVDMGVDERRQEQSAASVDDVVGADIGRPPVGDELAIEDNVHAVPVQRRCVTDDRRHHHSLPITHRFQTHRTSCCSASLESSVVS